MSVHHPLTFEKPITELEQQLAKLEEQPNPTPGILASIGKMREEIVRVRREVYENLDAWETVQVARHPERPQTLDYLELVFDEFVELHGDRAYGDDRAILSGFAKLDGRKVMFIGQQKGRNLTERTLHNYGMAHPEGYRKALQKMQLAGKFGLPIICFIDTSGAYPGIGAEERGIAYQIAYNLREMSQIPVPIVCTVIGEGGSGGALGIGVGDHVSILRYAYYSVISPEGCASILWKHGKFADQAARALRFTSKDLLEFGIVDNIIPEPLGGAHRDHRAMANTLKQSLRKSVNALRRMSKKRLLEQRYQKFRKIGEFIEQTTTPAEVEEPAAEAVVEQEKARVGS